MPQLIIFIFFWLCCSGAWAASPAPISNGEKKADVTVLSYNTKLVELNSDIFYFFETRPVTARQAAALPPHRWTFYSPGKLPYFGTHEEALWLRFKVRNMVPGDEAWLMEIFLPFINDIKVFQYYPHNGRWEDAMISGFDTPIKERPLPHRLFLFPMKLPRGQTTHIYMRCRSSSKLIIPIKFHRRQAYANYDRTITLVFGVYFGILAVMLCYNLSLSVFMEDKSYLIYSIYVFSIILYSLMTTGFGPYYLWDQSIWLKTNGYVILSSFAFLCATLFVRYFLSLKSYGGWILRVNDAILIYWAVSTALYTLKPHLLWIQLEDLAALFTTAAGIVTAVYLWRKGNVSARYFTIAWGFLIFGTFILMLSLSGVIPFNHTALFSQMVGFVIEVILLSLALAERFNREKNSREEAQQKALELSQKITIERESKLKAQRRLLQMQRRTKEELDYQVKVRTSDLEKAMGRLEEAHRELAELSIIDPLTKVHNRHYFDQIIESEIKRAFRSSHPLSLMMVDIDHFKAINDGFGHLVGDHCLRLVAKSIRRTVARSSDLVARYGGEEFALVLPGTTPASAMALAEKVRRAVEKIVHIHQGKAVKLSVSIGLVGWVPIKEETSRRLIEIADQALYLAKDNGRNRVEATVMAGDQIENSNQIEGMGGAN